MADVTIHDVPAVLAAVREIAEARIAPAAAEIDRTRSFAPAEHRRPGRRRSARAPRAGGAWWCRRRPGRTRRGLSRSSGAPTRRPAWCSSSTPSPRQRSPAAEAVRQLTAAVERNRIRRLLACGFDERTARHISDLHTPNLM